MLGLPSLKTKKKRLVLKVYNLEYISNGKKVVKRISKPFNVSIVAAKNVLRNKNIKKVKLVSKGTKNVADIPRPSLEKFKFKNNVLSK